MPAQRTPRRPSPLPTTEGEREYRAIFEATSDGLVINALDGTVLEVNPAFCRMHGFTRDELIGEQPTRFIAPDDHHLLRDYLAAVQAGGDFQARATDLRKDGTPFPVEVHGQQFVYRGQPAVLGVVRDITARTQAYELLEQRVTERTRELATLLEVSRQVVSTLELKPLLGIILDQLRVLMDYDGAGILGLEGDEFTVLGYRGPLPQETALGLRFRLSEELGHWYIVQSKQPLLIADTQTRWQEARETLGESGGMKTHFDYIRSWILVPLLYQDQVIGALSVEHSAPNHYTEQHATLALATANQAAIALEHARLYEQAQQAAALEERQRLARELHDSVSQAVYGLTLYTETASRLLARGETEAVAEYLGEMRDTAREALQEMRLLIFELRPPVLAEQGLVAALRARIESVEGRVRDLQATFVAEGDERREPRIEEALYRIAQEALNNALKYAQARTLAVTLWQEANATILEIADDGVGFDTSQVAQGRLGLLGMRERAAAIGATLAVESAPGQGTRIRVEVPR